ncbi:MAG: hypothetical protein ACTSUO_03070 [Candidatus Thorarchaeota archaeon]
MSRSGALVILSIFVSLSLCIIPVSATRAETTHSWQNGLSIDVHVENFDYWVLDEPGIIFIRLTLNNPGTVIHFGKLEFTIIVVTLENETVFVETESQLSQIGDYIDISEDITISADNVTLVDDYALLDYYFQYNLTVQLDGESELREYYTDERGPYHINVSPIAIFALWPYPIIFLMGGLYWGGFLGLRKFNARYKNVREINKAKEKTLAKW